MRLVLSSQGVLIREYGVVRPLTIGRSIVGLAITRVSAARPHWTHRAHLAAGSHRCHLTAALDTGKLLAIELVGHGASAAPTAIMHYVMMAPVMNHTMMHLPACLRRCRHRW